MKTRVPRLRLHYKGGVGFLTESQRNRILFHLKDKPHYSVEELRDLIERRYGVAYQSKQSYCDILKEAGLGWHRTRAVNPKRDEDRVPRKREEIKKKLDGRRDEIVEGQLIVYAQDESHLLWGDSTGYVWGRRGERTEVPIGNIKERQTDYGALNLRDHDFVLMPRESGNGENTVLFMKRLQELDPEKKLMIIWDGASYHDCGEVQAYLDEVNQGPEEKDWKITCLLFAPNAPEQNPASCKFSRDRNHVAGK